MIPDTRESLIAEYQDTLFSFACEVAEQGGIDLPHLNDFQGEAIEFVDRCIAVGRTT